MVAEKTVMGSLLALLFYTVWVRSGFYDFQHTPFWILCALFLLVMGYALIRSGRSICLKILKDPLFWFGALLNVLVFYQWRNMAQTAYVHIYTNEFIFEPAVVPGPFCIEPRLSKEVLLLFFPSWLMLLCLRNFFSRSINKVVLLAITINALLLALVGWLQIGLGWEKMFGFIEMNRDDFIASFWYPNHAGAFFYFMYAVSLGQLWDAVEKNKSLRSRLFLGFCALICGGISLATLSRAAVLGVTAITISAFILWAFNARKSFTVERSVNLVLLGGVLAIFLFVSLFSIRGGAVLREFRSDSIVQHEVDSYSNTRGWQVETGLEMFKDFPVFGIGGEGTRHFIFKYLPKEQWGKIRVSRAVHCDPIQFLAEHGSVGFLLIILSLGSILFGWRRFLKWRFKGLPLMVAVGASLVFLHSLIDLPFRNPAVLWHWLLLLALVPALAIERERV